MAPDRYGNPDVTLVLLDANALMMPGQFGIDIFGQIGELVGSFEPLVLEEVKGELMGLSRGCGRHAAAARMGLIFAEKCTTIPASPGGGPVDVKIARFAEAHRSTVATNDRELRNHLLSRGTDVIFIRKQKTLELIRS
ncbi:MAG: nucleotide-binding protein [Methanomicrobiaceae archaeon]|nr:nucleotide-binding protein [Methanomicrobiaceae archaeon]